MPPKNTKNMTKKAPKKRTIDPSKWSSRRGKTLGFEKYRFFAKNENQKMNCFYVAACGPEPCFLQAILTILGVKKVHCWKPFFVHLGASCCENHIFVLFLDDF